MAQMKLDIQPWQTPNYVIVKMPPRARQDGMIEAPKWELKDVDSETLSKLCDDFRRDVFLKAERVDPKAPGIR